MLGLNSGKRADLTGAKNCNELKASSCGNIEPLLIKLKMIIITITR
jgi:hypothetical protein